LIIPITLTRFLKFDRGIAQIFDRKAICESENFLSDINSY